MISSCDGGGEADGSSGTQGPISSRSLRRFVIARKDTCRWDEESPAGGTAPTRFGPRSEESAVDSMLLDETTERAALFLRLPCGMSHVPVMLPEHRLDIQTLERADRSRPRLAEPPVQGRLRQPFRRAHGHVARQDVGALREHHGTLDRVEELTDIAG